MGKTTWSHKDSLFLLLEILKRKKENWFQFIMFLNTLLKNEKKKECVIKTVNFISRSMDEHIHLWNIWVLTHVKFREIFMCEKTFTKDKNVCSHQWRIDPF